MDNSKLVFPSPTIHKLGILDTASSLWTSVLLSVHLPPRKLVENQVKHALVEHLDSRDRQSCDQIFSPLLSYHLFHVSEFHLFL